MFAAFFVPYYRKYRLSEIGKFYNVPKTTGNALCMTQLYNPPPLTMHYISGMKHEDMDEDPLEKNSFPGPHTISGLAYSSIYQFSSNPSKTNSRPRTVKMLPGEVTNVSLIRNNYQATSLTWRTCERSWEKAGGATGTGL